MKTPVTIEMQSEKEDVNLDNLKSASNRLVDDKEGICGVEEGPILKVHEIRAKYKVRDYENYATPKSAIPKNKENKDSEVPDGQQQESDEEPNTEVGQQVMSMFQGALDIEKELSVLEEEKLKIESQENTQAPITEESETTPTSESKPQPEKPRTNETEQKPPEKEAETTAAESKEKDASKNNTNPSPSPEDVKAKNVESFDESLDQFYDVLQDLAVE